ncbi:flagellar motor switch protein FliM [Aureliella helgolandensis]|uniref:Flagellar motor switch protein FliM n=1 Tax=Aureliella helgolandensis TaxID=2527968 RepID=A0A518G383_9BACT|nr:flagellar motor switch protein FliM [Aureliella helgolandensis]QDV23052.1 Flagellar motor switch protein FliM [Aureliella helgolandensis]
MEDDSLNRDEVEDLLRSMDSDEEAPASAGEMPDAAEAEARADAILSNRKPPGRQRVVSYDFKRPERVGKEQMRALQSLHEGFARNFGASISALLRTIVESKLISVDQLTYSEFVYSLEIPTCFNLLRPTPLDGNWILDLSPSILYPIIDRMLGGTASTDSTLKRPLSDIELRLTSRITNTFLRELARAWANTVALELELERVESNPQLVQIVPPNEVVVLVSFELTMGKSRGMVNLCIPFNTIERIGSKLSNNSWIGYTSSRSSKESQDRLKDLLGESKVELVVNLASSTIHAVDLMHLQVGDIVTTETDINTPLEILVEGVGKFEGKAGAFKGKKAVEVLQVVPRKQNPPAG